MNDQDWLAERFEANRVHLRGVAFRMLGSLTEAEDAVQEAWIRLSRTDTSQVDNLQAWLTTVVGRVCLNMLRSRKMRREASLETHLPDLILSPQEGIDPEQEALLGDSVGLAMLVVLDSLTPAERVAFVLHDVFAVPFDEIAPIIDELRRRRGNSRVVPVAASRARQCLTLILKANGRSSMPSLRHRVPVTSNDCLPSSTQRSCCAPTAGWRVRL
jgi:RNA polymerase sigma factor (sigma-70 family)